MELHEQWPGTGARNALFTQLPRVRDWFDLLRRADGGSNTVNVGSYDIDEEKAPFEKESSGK